MIDNVVDQGRAQLQCDLDDAVRLEFLLQISFGNIDMGAGAVLFRSGPVQADRIGKEKFQTAEIIPVNLEPDGIPVNNLLVMHRDPYIGGMKRFIGNVGGIDIQGIAAAKRIGGPGRDSHSGQAE